LKALELVTGVAIFAHACVAVVVGEYSFALGLFSGSIAWFLLAA